MCPPPDPRHHRRDCKQTIRRRPCTGAAPYDNLDVVTHSMNRGALGGAAPGPLGHRHQSTLGAEGIALARHPG
eukprot:189291-Pyramimonas_sp.AAC.1